MLPVRKDVYDGLERLCQVTGGIGGGQTYDVRGDPLCIWGHLAALGFTDERLPKATYKRTEALTPQEAEIFPIGGLSSDEQVEAVIGEGNPWGRISWTDYCALFGLVRGN